MKRKPLDPNPRRFLVFQDLTAIPTKGLKIHLNDLAKNCLKEKSTPTKTGQSHPRSTPLRTTTLLSNQVRSLSADLRTKLKAKLEEVSRTRTRRKSLTCSSNKHSLATVSFSLFPRVSSMLKSTYFIIQASSSAIIDSIKVRNDKGSLLIRIGMIIGFTLQNEINR